MNVPWQQRLQATAISRLWRILSRLSPTTLWRLSVALVNVAYPLLKRERAVTRLNLEVVYPDLTEARRATLGRESLKHSTATMLELGFAWQGDPDRVADSIVEVHGRELLDDARAEGKGVIILAPHFGNWLQRSTLFSLSNWPADVAKSILYCSRSRPKSFFNLF